MRDGNEPVYDQDTGLLEVLEFIYLIYFRLFLVEFITLLLRSLLIF